MNCRQFLEEKEAKEDAYEKLKFKDNYLKFLDINIELIGKDNLNLKTLKSFYTGDGLVANHSISQMNSMKVLRDT